MFFPAYAIQLTVLSSAVASGKKNHPSMFPLRQKDTIRFEGPAQEFLPCALASNVVCKNKLSLDLKCAPKFQEIRMDLELGSEKK